MGSIFELLSTLSPGIDVEAVFINGKEMKVKSFATFNATTSLAYFVKHNSKVLVVDYTRIGALKFK